MPRTLLRAAAVALLLVACPAAAAPAAPPAQKEIRLPRTWPQELALGADGSLWTTDEYGGVTRRTAAGRITSYDIGEDVSAADVAVDRAGAAWIAAYERIARVDEAGHVQTWPTDGERLATAITVAGDDVWLANGDRIERRSRDGSTTMFHVSGPRRTASVAGIAAGPDGALWFTQSGALGRAADGIGRMTSDGRYRSWPLPHRRAGPIRIAAGPDGALWFTERDAQAIGRITTSGAIREFPLTTGLGPYDIEAGADGALWFTADGCVGRITTAGTVTAWPLRGAGRLVGIAPAPDGSVWAADDLKSAVWHFFPPAGDTAPREACAPPTVTRASGSTRATLTYHRDSFYDGVYSFARAPTIAISRHGVQLLSQRVPGLRREPQSVFGETSGLSVRDLDGDREPEVLLLLNWGGAHCCAWTRVYRYARSRQAYVTTTHFWGDDFSPRIRDLDGDGRPELRSFDDRFGYAFGSFADSGFPIQIWSYRHGIFRDVTRRFPREIRRDAAAQWHYYERSHRRHGDVRGILAAWAADEYLLGRGASVWPTLHGLARRGDLECRYCFPRQGANAYLRALRAFLRKTGYLR